MKWIKRMRGDPIVDHFNLRLQAIAEGERFVPLFRPCAVAHQHSNKVIFQAEGSQKQRGCGKLKSYLRSQT
jgi:hypothetical protein